MRLETKKSNTDGIVALSSYYDCDGVVPDNYKGMSFEESEVYLDNDTVNFINRSDGFTNETYMITTFRKVGENIRLTMVRYENIVYDLSLIHI